MSIHFRSSLINRTASGLIIGGAKNNALAVFYVANGKICDKQIHLCKIMPPSQKSDGKEA